MLRAIVEVAEDILDPLALEGWQELIHYLVKKMKHGYDVEVRRFALCESARKM